MFAHTYPPLLQLFPVPSSSIYHPTQNPNSVCLKKMKSPTCATHILMRVGPSTYQQPNPQRTVDFSSPGAINGPQFLSQRWELRNPSSSMLGWGLLIKNSFNHMHLFICMHAYTCVCTHATACMWKLQDNLYELLMWVPGIELMQ